jgi:hypothetical protein
MNDLFTKCVPQIHLESILKSLATTRTKTQRVIIIIRDLLTYFIEQSPF